MLNQARLFVLLSLILLASAQSQPRGSDWPLVDRIAVGLSAGPLLGYPMQNSGPYVPGGNFFSVEIANSSFDIPTRLITLTVRGPVVAAGSFQPWLWTAGDWPPETTNLIAQAPPAGGLVGGVPVFVIKTLTDYGCVNGCDTGTWSGVTATVGDPNAARYLSEMPTLGAALASAYNYAWIVVEPEWNSAQALVSSSSATGILRQAVQALKTAVAAKPGIKVGVGYQIGSDVALNRNTWVRLTTGSVNFGDVIRAADFVGLTPRTYANVSSDIKALQFASVGGARQFGCSRFLTDCGQANVAHYAAIVDLWEEFQKPSMTPYLNMAPPSLVPDTVNQDPYDVGVCDYTTVWSQIPGALMLRGFFAHGSLPLMSSTETNSSIGLVSATVVSNQIDPSMMYLKFAAGPPLPAPQNIAYRAFLAGQETANLAPADPNFATSNAGTRVFAAYRHSYTIYNNSYVNFAWTMTVGGNVTVNRNNGITGQVNTCPITNNPCMLAQFPASPTAADKIDFRYAPDGGGASPSDLMPANFSALEFSLSLNSAAPPDCTLQWTAPSPSAVALLSDYLVGNWVDGATSDAWNLFSVPMTVWSAMPSLQQLTLACNVAYSGGGTAGIRFNVLTLVRNQAAPSTSPTPSVSASPSQGASAPPSASGPAVSSSPSPAVGISVVPSATPTPSVTISRTPSVSVSPAAAGAGQVVITLTPPSGGAAVTATDQSVISTVIAMISSSGLTQGGPTTLVRNPDGSVTVTTYVLDASGGGGSRAATDFEDYVIANDAVLTPMCTPDSCTVAAAATGGGGGGGGGGSGSGSATGLFGLSVILGWVIVGIIALCGCCCLVVCFTVVVVVFVAVVVGIGALINSRAGNGGSIKNLSMGTSGGDAWGKQHGF